MKFFSRSAVSWVFLAVGLLALVLLVREVTLARLLEQLLGFGAAFLVVLLIELASNYFSNYGWYYSFRPERRPPYSRVFLVSMASLSVAGALPTGQAQEFFKGNMLRGTTPSSEIVSSLLVYNYLHILTTSLVVLVAAVWALTAGTFPTGLGVRVTLVAGLVLAGTGAFWVLLHVGLMERLLRRLRALPWERLRPSESLMDGARQVDARLKTFSSEHPGDLLRATFYLLVGRVFSVVEVYVIMWKLGLDHSLAAVCMVFAMTSLANYLLMILPAREGFLEGSTYLIFGMIGFDPASGLSLELIRRIRKIFYQGLGVLLIPVGMRIVSRAKAPKPGTPQ